MDIGSLVTQEALRIEAEAQEELWVAVRIISYKDTAGIDAGVAIMGIFSTLEAAKERCSENASTKALEWERRGTDPSYRFVAFRSTEIKYIIQKEYRK